MSTTDKLTYDSTNKKRSKTVSQYELSKTYSFNTKGKYNDSDIDLTVDIDLERLTSDGTAAPTYVLTGKTYYIYGKLLEGKMPIINTISLNVSSMDVGSTITSASSSSYTLESIINDTPTDLKSYVYSALDRGATTVRFSITNSNLAASIGLTADKILKGNTILGIAGTVESGSTLGKVYKQSNFIMSSTDSSICVTKFFNKILVAQVNNALYYSEDGIDWTISNITTGAYYSKANEVSGYALLYGEAKGCLYSTDGKTWTNLSGSLSTANISYATVLLDSLYVSPIRNGLWRTLGTIGTTMYRCFSLTSAEYYDKIVTFGAGKKQIIIAIGGDSNTGIVYYMKGSDTSWTKYDTITSRIDNIIQLDNGLYVATSSVGSHSYYSSDLITWNTHIGIVDYDVYTPGALAYVSDKPINGSRYIGIANNNTGLYYSVDGKEWIQSSLTDVRYSSSSNNNGLYISNNYNFAIQVFTLNSAGSQNGIWYTTNGIDWTKSNRSGTYLDPIVELPYYNLLYSGYYYSEDNGKTWVRSNLSHKIYNEYLYVTDSIICYNYDTYLYYSTDGKVWTKVNTNHMSGLTFGGISTSIVSIKGRIIVPDGKLGFLYSE